MRFNLLRRARRTTAFAALVCAISISVIGGSRAGATTVPLSISIVGNHFVDGAHHTVRLLGVNHSSGEYGCVDGFGYDDGHFDNADAAAIASWGADAVRIPLNEDCWLGINGQPNSNQGADPALTKAGYQRAIKTYVAYLNRHGIYAILDLHWSAPGAQVALEQQPMPDLDHSPAFWKSVATTFKTNRAVVFDLFNEPYDPTDPKSGDDANTSDKVTWNCWQTGTHSGASGGTRCYTAAYDENDVKTTRYQVAGMQTLLNAVRKTGAKQPVLTGGLDYANDLGVNDHGGEWRIHAPKDPLKQEAASFHNYMGKACESATCWTNMITPIAKQVPVVTGEFAEDNFDERKCADKTHSTFDARYMNWADSAGVSYLAWGWGVEPQAEQDADRCSAFVLISNYTAYTPAQPNGVAVHDHLRALAAKRNTPPPVTLTTFRDAVGPGSTRVAFTLRSPESSSGSITGTTVHRYAPGESKPHQIALGSVHVTLTANKSGAARLTLSAASHNLLVSKRSLPVQFTITLTSPHHRRTVIHHTVTLHANG